MNSAAEAFDAAFTGSEVHFLLADGNVEVFDLPAWTGAASASDTALFVDHCSGPTLDVGCGPGRLVQALTEKRVPALGIDVSAAAIAMTRARGGAALMRDVFEDVPGEGQWQHAILADGNIGIGGDPARLLSRLGHLLAPAGTVLVEVQPRPTGLTRERRRLRIGDEVSAEFDWAVVGSDAIGPLAAGAGWTITRTNESSGRRVVCLQRSED